MVEENNKYDYMKCCFLTTKEHLSIKAILKATWKIHMIKKPLHHYVEMKTF